jgi:hypothetical protein
MEFNTVIKEGGAMKKLHREDLFSLEEYAKRRNTFRDEVLAHKKHRQVHLGEHITLYFEDRLTIQYQIQEMLRTERIFEAEGIADELGAYNPLVPDGRNLKATMMIEYVDIDERREALRKLLGVEDKIWLQVAGHDKVFAIADEDMERTTEEKTSAVHFLRFEFTPAMIQRLKAGGVLTAGVDHPAYGMTLPALPRETNTALIADFD